MPPVDVSFAPYRSEDKAGWDDFVSSCDAGWLYHKSAFIDNSVFSIGEHRDFVSNSFAVRLSDKPEAIAGIGVFCLRKNGLGKVLMGPGLALSKPCLKKDVLESIGAALVTYALERGCAAVQMRLPPMAPAYWRLGYAESILAELGFSIGPRDGNNEFIYGFSTVIDLTQDLAGIVRKFNPRRKSQIKHCKELALSCVMESGGPISDRTWDDFKTLYVSYSSEVGFAAYTDDQMTVLKDAATRGEITIANLYENNVCITSFALESYKGAVFYYVGSANERGKEIGGMSYLHYKSIERMAERGFKTYCLGTSHPLRLNGIELFKKSFGGERWDCLSGELVVDRIAHTRQVILPDALLRSQLLPPWLLGLLSRIRKIIR